MFDIHSTAEVFLSSLRLGERCDFPYPHWLLQQCLPAAVVDDVTNLPIAPAHIEDTQGRRETHNDRRIHFGERYRTRYGVMATLAEVFQSPEVARALEAATGATLGGTSLRIEYCQDSGDFWLEPHTDIGVKKFTMLIYLNREAEGADWGTDIYSDRDTHVGRAPAGFNKGLIFVPSDKTWHGFEKRPMSGVRKSLIINYVGPEWRNRHELCFPEETIPWRTVP
jgi:hypothetical protein